MHPIVILVGLFSVVLSAEICCPEVDICFTDDPPHDHYPLPQCPDDIGASMTVFTRSNPTDGQAITRTTIPPAWQAGKWTHFLVHGWLGSRDNQWLHSMKDSLLTRGDYNVVIVGWDDGSQQIWYPQSASDTRSVGSDIAAVMNNLVTRENEDPSLFYCAGHSLGSHVCGHSGMWAKNKHGFEMGRITGMDPAGPLFENKEDITVGLNPSSAAFVDVMHTNGEEGIIMNLGTMRILGHADFYPNGGGRQPGCQFELQNTNLPIGDKLDSEEYDIVPACSHMRAIFYYLESIESPCYYSRYRCQDQHNLPGSCEYSATPFTVMGFDTFPDYQNEQGIYYLTTEEESPYCQG